MLWVPLTRAKVKKNGNALDESTAEQGIGLTGWYTGNIKMGFI